MQNRKKYSQKEGDSLQRRGSRSIAGTIDDDAASDSSMQRRKLFKKMNSIKVIVHKVLVKGMFKHIQEIQGKIEEEHVLHPPKTHLPRRGSILKTPISRSRHSDSRKNSTTKNQGKIKSSGNANIIRFNSENRRYLDVPKGESLDSHKYRRKNTGDHYASSMTSRSNSFTKQRSSKKSSKVIVPKPSVPEKAVRISLK